MWWMLLVAVMLGVLLGMSKLAKSYQKKLDENSSAPGSDSAQPDKEEAKADGSYGKDKEK